MYISSFKVPKNNIYNKIPRNNYGKVDRKQIEILGMKLNKLSETEMEVLKIASRIKKLKNKK